MSFIDTTKSNIAFKLSLGKIHTNNNREVFNEPEGSGFISMGQFAWAQGIHPSNPSDSSNSGIVSSLLTLKLEAVSGTDGTGTPSAYYCKLGSSVPSDLVGKINPRTGAPYAANDRVGNIIPTAAGIAYRPKLFNGAVETTPLDSSDWFIDCFAGVVSQETDVPASMINYGTTGTVQAYVYIGKTVADAIIGVQAAASAVKFYDKQMVGNGVTGDIDGVNTVFTLSHTPDTNSDHVYLNGVLQNAGANVDYTITGNVINFIGTTVPVVGDILIVSYRTTSV